MGRIRKQDLELDPQLIAQPPPAPPSQQPSTLSASAARMIVAINALTDSLQPGNTKNCYDPKTVEYHQYCNFRFWHLDETQRYVVTSNKLWEFLFYASFREQRPRGGNSRKK